jgi:hypothetical protein
VSNHGPRGMIVSPSAARRAAEQNSAYRLTVTL